MWDDFSYPSQVRPLGVIEHGLAMSIGALLAANVAAVEGMLRNGDRDLLGDCLYATANWARALTASGAAVRRVGGVGEHKETVPATRRDQLGGYMTDDDSLVEHWWLMVEPHGLIFDPTAHQFDKRGGVDVSRYQVGGRPVLEWRRQWPTCATGFPLTSIQATDATWRTRLRLRSGR